MRKTTVALALAAFAVSAGAPAAIGTAGAVSPQAAFAPQAATCSGVWVVVDFGSLGGGVSTRCATSHGTGVAALRSAGFSPVVEDGFVYKLSGKPSKPDINKAYWSYWQATKQADGGYSSWKYSNLGAGSSQPKQGNAEGWHYVSLSAGNTPPGAKPPTGDDQASPTPKPKPTTSKPSPKPSKTTTKPTVKPTKTITRSATAGASTTSATRKAPTTASSKATPTLTPSSSSPIPGSADPTDEPSTQPGATETGLAQDQPTATADSGRAGSPVGAIAVGSVVVAGAAGLGGWWMLKGRKR